MGQTKTPSTASALFLLLSLAISLSVAHWFHSHMVNPSLFRTGNLVGPTAESLLQHRGISVYTDAMGNNPLLFRAARMPLPSLFIAACAAVLGSTAVITTSFIKTTLFLLPLGWSALHLLRQRTAWRTTLAFLLLLLPFLTPLFLADVVNLQVEEAYAYSLLAFIFSLCIDTEEPSRARKIAVCIAIPLLLLTKSSLLPAVIVLSIVFCMRAGKRARIAIASALVLTALALGSYRLVSAGRFTLGTSLDGENLHKGNNALFLDRYPPLNGLTLDSYDQELNQGHLFTNEWQFNDYHQAAAVQYIRSQPGKTLHAAFLKAYVFFLAPGKYGSGTTTGAIHIAESAGVIAFRLSFWLATGLAVFYLFSSSSRRKEIKAECSPIQRDSITFLLLTLAVATPYVAGFAYTRHASLLFYPAVLLLCRMLQLPSRAANVAQ